MTRNPITVDSETLIADALKLMKENNIRRLPVVTKGKLEGMVTHKESQRSSSCTYQLNERLRIASLSLNTEGQENHEKRSHNPQPGYPFRRGFKNWPEEQDQFILGRGK